MKKKIEFVLLPTENKSHIVKNSFEELFYKQDLGLLWKMPVFNQHVYITASQDVEPIKEGDWFINGLGELWKHNGKVNPNKFSKKIIGTTDPKLLIKCTDGFCIGSYGGNCSLCKYVPQLQQSFLKEYVANPDGEFEVEYLQNGNIDFGYGFDYIIKLNQDNTVNITTAVEKKMYSKEEVVTLINKFSEYADSCVDHDGIMNACCSITSCEWDEDNWIKENL